MAKAGARRAPVSAAERTLAPRTQERHELPRKVKVILVSEDRRPKRATKGKSAEPAAANYEKCPHCGNTTLIEPSSSLRFQCGICGKARVPVDLPDFERSDGEIPALARASAHHTAAMAWTAGSTVLGAFSAVSLAVLGLVLSALNPGAMMLAVGLIFSLLPAGLAVHGVRRAKALRSQVGPALDEGWLSVTREVLESQGTIDDKKLAKTLRVAPELAEHLLAQLSAGGVARHRLDDPEKLSFEAPRVRVADEGDHEAERDQEDLEAAEALEQASKKKRVTGAEP